MKKERPPWVPREVYLSVELRLAAYLIDKVGREQVVVGENEEHGRVLHAAASDVRRVARSLETDEPLLPR